MTAVIIERFSLPDNLAMQALLETLLIFLTILIAGFVINIINTGLTGFTATLTGEKPAFILRNYLTYIGTVHHELSHALVALLTGARVKRINLIPRGATLGSVDIETRGNIFLRSIQLSLSAVAPVVMGALSLILLWQNLLPRLSRLWHYIAFWYLFISILLHMTMSGTDYISFFKGMIPSLVVFFLFFLVLGAFGFVF